MTWTVLGILVGIVCVAVIYVKFWELFLTWLQDKRRKKHDLSNHG